MDKNNFSVIFQDGPIGRAFLNYFKLKKYQQKKIYYLYKKKFLPKKMNLKMHFNENNYYPLKFIKNKNIYELCVQIETYFQFEKNFIQNMYNFDLLDFFKDQIVYIPNEDVNSDLLFNQIVKSGENTFLNTSNQIYKNILKTNKNFYHIHPGYLYKVRGADGTLNSIKHFNEIGASSFLMEKKIDKGKILKRFRMNFDKISFPNYEEFSSYDLYQIWYSFFDPALRVFLLKKMLDENTNLTSFEKNNLETKEDRYFSFIEKKEIKDLFKNKIFI